MTKLMGSALFIATLLAGGAAFADDAAGTAVYDKQCKSCHAADGSGNPDKAKMLKIDPAVLSLGKADTKGATKDDLKKIVLEGKNKMPSYAKKLKPEEVDPVIDHAMALGKALREKK